MDVRELRIGNWVYDSRRTQFPMYVTGFSEDGYVTLNFPGNEGMDWEADAADLEPIRLDADVRNRLGFVAYGDTRYEKEGESWTITIHPYFPLIRIESFYENSGDLDATFTSEKIKYLHELQNAFYLTTKQELKIEL